MAPVAPAAPVRPVAPVAPVAPWGMTKFKMALVSVPVLVTLAGVPGAPVVTVPISMVAAAPAGLLDEAAYTEHCASNAH